MRERDTSDPPWTVIAGREVVAIEPEPPPGRPRRHLGRYVVLDRIGVGGMGAVYTAYDPELDRQVAVKVLRGDRARSPTGDTHRRRLQREAQTLAKLNHPNIVRVYDVGVVDDHMFIAMELLAGLSVRRWLAAEPRRVDEVLAVFAAAAEGLDAAHQAGIVHRDFKPDNVVVCTDGRPVVLDFGIARVPEIEIGAPEVIVDGPEAGVDDGDDPALTNPGRAMGTPAYMAPEQHVGGVIDGRSDQYGWCVSLWEALGGVRPFGGRATTLMQRKRQLAITMPDESSALPSWLVPVLLRGLSPSPADRFPSMGAITAAIADARPRRGRRRRLAAIAGAIGVGGVAVLAARPSDRAEMCALGEGRLDGAWNDAVRSGIATRFRHSAVAYAPGTWTLLQPRLDDYVERWRGRWRISCPAAGRGDAAAGREVGCLEAQREAFAARVEVLRTATSETIENASRIVAELAGPERCTAALRQPDLAHSDPSVRDQVATVRVALAGVEALEVAGRYADGLERGNAALAEATRLAYPPLLAEALLHVGRMHRALGHYAEAREVLTDAAWTATAAGHDEIAARAMTDLVVVVGRELGDAAAGHVWATNAEVAIARAGGDELLEAALLSNLGLLQFREGAFDEARRGDELALSIRTRLLGEAHPVVAASHNNLGGDLWMLGRYADAEAQLRASIAAHEAIAGPDHPRIAAALDNLGALLAEQGDHAGARPLIERALRIREAGLGPDHPSLADTLINLGALYVALDDEEGATGLFERARGIIERGAGPDHPTMATCLSNLGGVQLRRGDYDGAMASFSRAAEIYEASFGPDHVKVGLTLANLGEVQRLRGELSAAERSLSRAMTIVDGALGPDHPRLAFPVGRLGLTLLATGDPSRAAALLARAVALGSDVEIVRGEGGMLRFALARAIAASSGDLARARALAADARALTTGASDRRAIDAWLAALDRPDAGRRP